jgi:hypothetical protein
MRRLEELTLGLMEECRLIGKGEDPLLYRERQDYMSQIQKATIGLEKARVALVKALQRIEPDGA